MGHDQGVAITSFLDGFVEDLPDCGSDQRGFAGPMNIAQLRIGHGQPSSMRQEAILAATEPEADDLDQEGTTVAAVKCLWIEELTNARRALAVVRCSGLAASRVESER